jgi:hypothetical protein
MIKKCGGFAIVPFEDVVMANDFICQMNKTIKQRFFKISNVDLVTSVVYRMRMISSKFEDNTIMISHKGINFIFFLPMKHK